MSVHCALPARPGLGLRLPHIRQVLAERPTVAWFEVHPENYFDGGANLAALELIARDYPLSLHGVGLGLGSVAPLDAEHLQRFRRLIDHLDPQAVSEHLAWNRLEAQHFNDLLPLPYTEEALDLICARIDQAQTVLGRTLLIENLSSYVSFVEDRIPEGEFLAELARRTGCGLLLDLNNLHVNQLNLGRDAGAAIACLPADAIAEIHIAGFERREDGLYLDTHGSAVCAEVWQLLAQTLARIGPRPVLLERDTCLPALEVLLDELSQADALFEREGSAS